MQQDNITSHIFPLFQPLPKIIENPRLRQEVLQQIREDPDTLTSFHRLSPSDQNALLDFCMGNRNLQITYDPFFREIFHPLKHPQRLSQFLSALLGQPVTIHDILPREGIQASGESSLMVMDILVKTSDGSLINIEMQKVGYDFPIERTFCYGSDLLVRQYNRIRDDLKNNFRYKYMRPVYIIVLMEKSPALFHQYPDCFIHNSSFQLNSGLPIKNLLNFIYIPLDIFLQNPHNELTELEAWLYFLSSSNPFHIQRIIEKYPFFKELYKDIINFRFHPKELITMYSEALLIADRNAITDMVDELKQQVESMQAILSEKDAKMKAALSEKDAEISRLKALLEQQNA